MKSIAASLLFFLLLFISLRAWMDYACAVPVPGKVERYQSRWNGKHREREYEFGNCRYTVVERDRFLGRFLGFFGADAPELDGVREGDRVTLWLPASGGATPVLRMPIGTTIVPFLLLLLLLADRGKPVVAAPPRTVSRVRPDGSTEAWQDRHRCLGCIFLDNLTALVAFGALILIGLGVFAPFLEGESTMRQGLAFASVVLVLAPIFTLVQRVEPVPSVRWNESTVWIHGVAFQRSAIREVVLRNGILEIRREGSRWKRSFIHEADWAAAQLEKLGVDIRRLPET
jgi:hypothetical protein